ncbi:MAG: DUF1152 domain-containing protein, partial [Elusimicrobia bacterium]|nr:DUF1152 domain-containing protein [Elusimicrobiota bacterium]
RLFPEPGEFYVKLRDEALRLGIPLVPPLGRPADKPELSFDFHQITLECTRPLEPAEIERLNDWIGRVRRTGAPSLSMVQTAPNRLVVSASYFDDAFVWFGSAALRHRGEPLRRVVVIDRGSFKEFRKLGAVGEGAVVRFQGSEPPFGRQVEPGVQTHRSTARSYPEASHLILQSVIRAIRGSSAPGVGAGTLWGPEHNPTMNPGTLRAMADTYGTTPPRVLIAELRRGLTKKFEPVPTTILEDLLQFAGADPTGGRVAVITSAPAHGRSIWQRLGHAFRRLPEPWADHSLPFWLKCQLSNVYFWRALRGIEEDVLPPTVQQQFLDRLVSYARETDREALLSRFWMYAEFGSVKLRYDARARRFVPVRWEGGVRLRRQVRIHRAVVEWLAREGVTVEHLMVTPYQIGFHLAGSGPGSEAIANRVVDGVRALLDAGFPEGLRVNIGGPNHLVVNMSTPSEAARNFLHELEFEHFPERQVSKPLVISAYSGSVTAYLPRFTTEGREISLRELAERNIEETPTYHTMRIDLPGEVPEILRRGLPAPAAVPVAPAVAAPPAAPAGPAPLRLQDPGGNNPLPGSYGTFHAAASLSWLTNDPPERIFLFSGGGGGDIKSVIFLADRLRKMYREVKAMTERGGGQFRIPQIILVDSTVKRSFENPYGGPPPIRSLTTPAPTGSGKERLQPWEGSRCFFQIPENLYVHYNLPDENGHANLPMHVDVEWSIGKPKVREILGRHDFSEFILMDGNHSPEEIAADLKRINGRHSFGVIGVDVGGDALARLVYPQHLDEEHEEEGVRSGTTDTYSVAILNKLSETGDVPVSLAIGGLGRDGELYVFQQLEGLFEHGGVEGAWDMVGYHRELAAHTSPEAVRADI